MQAWTIITAAGIPSALTAFLFWWLQRHIAAREKKEDEREKARTKKDVLLVKGINASIALSEATATALKNGKCNGETEKALNYTRDVKHDIKDFLTEQSMKNINNGG